MLTWLGYIDGIHGAPYIAAPWIRHGISCIYISDMTHDMTNSFWLPRLESAKPLNILKQSAILPLGRTSFPWLKSHVGLVAAWHMCWQQGLKEISMQIKCHWNSHESGKPPWAVHSLCCFKDCKNYLVAAAYFSTFLQDGKDKEAYLR